jgi:uncharacterized protein YbjT (DUF2867 family)
MQPLTAVVLGATGLIGEFVVKKLLEDDAFIKVRILVRRPSDLVHRKLEVQVVNFGDMVDYQAKLGGGDCIFCCIGTTQKQVKGDTGAYRKVDYDIAVHAAKLGKAAGFKKYMLVSSLGANATSGNFYLKLKGEVEAAIAEQHYDSFHVFRPGMLLGRRKEIRPGELVGKGLMKPLNFLLVGSLKKYKAIHAEDVATAMVQASKITATGMVVYHYDDMMKLREEHV